MKRVLPLLLLLSVTLPIFGHPIDETTAKKLAENFWKENHIMGVKNGMAFKATPPNARFVNVAQQLGYAEFYIFNNTESKGFVIIAADDCITPVLGYSYENSFDGGMLPPGFKELLDDYALQIQSATKAKAQADGDTHMAWKNLQQGKTLPIKSETTVGPLITTQWGQSPYYNALCPYDNNANDRTLTGCVATAMAQVMKYWSYPEHGSGSHSYIPKSHPEYGSLYVDFSSVNYQWSSMPNNVNSSNDAVATLMYHCGVSVDMNYGISGAPDYGSSAYIVNNSSGRPCAEVALKTYFDYKSSLHGALKSNYSDAQWVTLLKDELDHGRPMVYAGFGSGGHAFVCDGYDNGNYFHFNWGWKGNYNGFFYINNLNPSTHNYSDNQQAVIGIEPSYSGNGGGGGTTGFNLVYQCSLSMEESYWFFDDLSVYTEIANNGDANFNGYMAAGVFRKEDGEYRFLNVMEQDNMASNPLEPGYYTYGTFGCAGGPPYTPGSYVVAMLYSMDGEVWNLIDCGPYSDAYFNIVYADYIETGSSFSITSGEYLYYGKNATVNVDVWNTGTTTFYGSFRVNLANEDGSWAQNIGIVECSEGLGSGYHFTDGINFTGPITVEPGIYYIELAYQTSGSSSWYYAGASYYPNPVLAMVVVPPVTGDPYENNNTVNNAALLPLNMTGITGHIATNEANLQSDDIDYYKVQFNYGTTYTVNARLNDSYSSNDGIYYTVDAKVAYSLDGSNWSAFSDDVLPSFTVSGGMVYFCVMPYFEGDAGTYQLSISINGTSVDENDETLMTLHPNPVKETLHIDCENIQEIRVCNLLGNTIKTLNVEGHNQIQIDMTGLPSGTYLLQAVGEHQTTTRRVVKID